MARKLLILASREPIPDRLLGQASTLGVLLSEEFRIMETGTRYGRYEILAPRGKGGMGEVWCTRDTGLGCAVATKGSLT